MNQEENILFEPESKISEEKTSVVYHEPYHQIKKKERSIRDDLAIERTKLAEERTQLSYIRTGISLLLGGLFFVGYFEHGTLFSYIGYATIVIAAAFLLYGFYHHKKSMDFLNRLIEITLKEEEFNPQRNDDD